MDEGELDEASGAWMDEVDVSGVELSAAGLGEGDSKEESGVLEASDVVLEGEELCSSEVVDKVVDSEGGDGDGGDVVLEGVVVASPSVVDKAVELSVEDVVELLEPWSPSGLEVASRFAPSGRVL